MKFGFAFGLSWHELWLSDAAIQVNAARHARSMYMHHFFSGLMAEIAEQALTSI